MNERDHAKRISVAYFQAFIDGDMGWWRENVAPDFRRHDPGLAYAVVGPEGLQHHHDVLLAGVPDLNLPIHDVMEDGGKVLVRLRFRGTHRGTLFDIPATGNAIDIEVFDLFRVENGKLAEHWAMVDTLGLLRQLGVTRI